MRYLRWPFIVGLMVVGEVFVVSSFAAAGLVSLLTLMAFSLVGWFSFGASFLLVMREVQQQFNDTRKCE